MHEPSDTFVCKSSCLSHCSAQRPQTVGRKLSSVFAYHCTGPSPFFLYRAPFRSQVSIAGWAWGSHGMLVRVDVRFWYEPQRRKHQFWMVSMVSDQFSNPKSISPLPCLKPFTVRYSRSVNPIAAASKHSIAKNTGAAKDVSWATGTQLAISAFTSIYTAIRCIFSGPTCREWLGNYQG